MLLFFFHLDVYPYFKCQPENQKNVVVDQHVTLSCEVVRETKLQWYKVEENDNLVKLSGESKDQLTFEKISKSNSGKYFCKASIDGQNPIDSDEVTIEFKSKYVCRIQDLIVILVWKY